MNPDLDDLSLAEVRFRALVAEWDLCRRQVAALLGLAESDSAIDLVAKPLGADAEQRIRLLPQVRDLLGGVLMDPRDAPLWVRAAYSHANELSPLTVMAAGADCVPAVRDQIRVRTH